jgi:hypothetical protein
MLHYIYTSIDLLYRHRTDTNFIEGSKAKKFEKPMKHVAKKMEAI